MKNIGTQQIETERIILRKFKTTDAEDMFNNWASDDEVTKYLTWPTHREIEVSQEVINSWIESYSDDKFYQWCIEIKTTNEVIGGISVVEYKENIEAVEIGFCIGRKFWNKGYTTEAFRALIKFFFESVGVNRIESRHDTVNENSGKVMRKCGLKYEGTRIKADRNNSGICDVSMYEILNTDYNKNKI